MPRTVATAAAANNIWPPVVMVKHDVDQAILLAGGIVVKTNGPRASIGDELSIELAQPRDQIALASDARFAA